jgi:hypothetical protein
MANSQSTLATRFWEKVRVAGPDECWEWQAGQYRCGYGCLRVDSKRSMVGAHRVSWLLHFGPIPDRVKVCHHCDNRLCVNPAHLFLGTQADNVRDMVEKQRGPDRHGERNGRAKLTAGDVRFIRSSADSGVQLARRFGVTRTQISAIRKRQTWRHID